ncbi:hypothetical protein ACO0LD_03215 [Undibacterium sp. Ji83W]|uniref:hypothetical protein n=1 Tax=Undibacterium sp. Ji83W TaxID=3413043 RepID=UPI003BF2F802
MKNLIFLMFLFAVTSAHADAFKCSVNGKVVFQEFPCVGSGEKIRTEKKDQQRQDDGYENVKRENAEYARSLKVEYDNLKEKQESQKLKAEINAKIYNENLPKMRAEQEKEDLAKAEKFELQQKANKDALKTCLESKCSSSSYYVLLKDMLKIDVEGTIKNCSTQVLTGGDLFYCSVPIVDSGRVRIARLQMELGVPSNIPNLVKVKTKRITSVNVY